MKEETSIVPNEFSEKNHIIIDLKKSIDQCINEIIYIDEKISKIVKNKKYQKLNEELIKIDSDDLKEIWRDHHKSEAPIYGFVNWLLSTNQYENHDRIYKDINNNIISIPSTVTSANVHSSSAIGALFLILPIIIETYIEPTLTKNFYYKGASYDECHRYVRSYGINSIDNKAFMKFSRELIQPALGIYQGTYICEPNEFIEIKLYTKIKNIPENKKRIKEIKEELKKETIEHENLRNKKEIVLNNLKGKLKKISNETQLSGNNPVEKIKTKDRFMSFFQFPSLSFNSLSTKKYAWHIPINKKVIYSTNVFKCNSLGPTTSFSNHFLIVSDANILRLWDVGNINVPMNTLSWDNGGKIDAITVVDNIVISLGNDEKIKFWILNKLEEFPVLSAEKPCSLLINHNFAILSNNKKIIIGGEKFFYYELNFWDISNIQQPVLIKCLKMNGSFFSLLALSQNIFAISYDEKHYKTTTCFLDVNDVIQTDLKNNLLRPDNTHDDIHISTVLSNNMVICSAGHMLEIWDVQDIKSPAKISEWPAHEDAIEQTALLSKNFLVSISSFQGQIKIWDIKDLKKPILAAICKGLQEDSFGALNFSLFTLPSNTIGVAMGNGILNGGFVKLWQPEKVLSLETNKQSVEILHIDFSDFNLSVNNEKIWQEFGNYLKKYPHIKTLDFRHNALNKINSSFFKTLIDVLKNTNIKTLDIRNNNFIDANALTDIYTEFENNKILLRIELDLLEKIALTKGKLSNSYLDFSYCDINDNNLEVLKKILELCDENLYKLNLYGNFITHLGLNKIINFIKEKKPSLAKLNLAANLINTKGADGLLECNIYWISESEFADFKEKNKDNKFSNSFIFVEDKQEFYYQDDSQLQKIEINSEMADSFSQELKRKMKGKNLQYSDYKDINRLLQEHKSTLPQAKTNLPTIKMSKNFIKESWFSEEHQNLFQNGNVCSFFKNSKNIKDTSIVDKNSLISTNSRLIFLAREMRTEKNSRHTYLLMEWINDAGQHVLEKYDFGELPSKFSQSESENGGVVITDCSDDADRWLEHADNRAYIKWETTPETAKKLRLSILKDQNTPPKYKLVGFNCFDWCMTKLNVIKDHINFDEKEIRNNSVFPNPEWMIKN